MIVYGCYGKQMVAKMNEHGDFFLIEYFFF